MPKPSFLKNSFDTFMHSLRDRAVHIFPNGINRKVNVIAQLEFELADFEAANEHINGYATIIFRFAYLSLTQPHWLDDQAFITPPT